MAHSFDATSLFAGDCELALTILIPEATVKFVIGKRGQQLTLLRSRAGIMALRLDGKTNKLTVRGTATAVKELEEEVGAIVARAERTLRLPVADRHARDGRDRHSDVGGSRRVDDDSEDTGSGVDRLCIVDTIPIPASAVLICWARRELPSSDWAECGVSSTCGWRWTRRAATFYGLRASPTR